MKMWALLKCVLSLQVIVIVNNKNTRTEMLDMLVCIIVEVFIWLKNEKQNLPEKSVIFFIIYIIKYVHVYLVVRHGQSAVVICSCV